MIKSDVREVSDPERRIEHHVVLTADGAVVREGVESSGVQVSLQFLQGSFSAILRLTAVHWLVRQQEDTILTPLGRLQRTYFQMSVLGSSKGFLLSGP